MGTTDFPRKAHILKCNSLYFDWVRQGHKTAELRLDDREYKIGDFIILCQNNDSQGKIHTGRRQILEITHVLHTRDPHAEGLTPGYVMISFRNHQEADDIKTLPDKKSSCPSCKANEPKGPF